MCIILRLKKEQFPYSPHPALARLPEFHVYPKCMFKCIYFVTVFV